MSHRYLPKIYSDTTLFHLSLLIITDIFVCGMYAPLKLMDPIWYLIACISNVNALNFWYETPFNSKTLVQDWFEAYLHLAPSHWVPHDETQSPCSRVGSLSVTHHTLRCTKPWSCLMSLDKCLKRAKVRDNAHCYFSVQVNYCVIPVNSFFSFRQS